MEFICEHYFAAPVDRVMAMYRDPNFIPAKYRELGLLSIDVSSSHFSDDRLHITCRFKQKASIEVPKIARKFVHGGDWIATMQTDTWNIPDRTGRLDVVIEPFKAFTSIRCDMKLEPRGEGSVNRMRWTVECSAPLIGGTLAKIISEDIQAKSERDGVIAQRLLSARA